MMKAILNLQAKKVPSRRRRRPVKVLVPVNLRGLFPSQSLRNFAQYVTPEADSRLGDYTLRSLCRIVHHRMGLEVTRKNMSARIATNVNSERIPILKVMPLFIKNFAMKMVFDTVGECKSLPVHVQSGCGTGAGCHAAVYPPDGFYHWCAGQGTAQLWDHHLGRYSLYQYDPQYPGAGAWSGISMRCCTGWACR